MMSDTDGEIFAIIQEGEGDEQISRAGEARFLYRDSGFMARRAFADAIADRYWIATSAYSLTPPWVEIEPYDDAFPSEGDTYPDVSPESWARDAYLALHSESGKWFGCEKFVVLASEQYVDLLGRALDAIRDTSVAEPPDIQTPFVDITEPSAREEWIDERLTESGAFK